MNHDTGSKMKVLLIDGDSYNKKDKSTGIPNLALMKISAWHKARGDTVGLEISEPDRIYASSVFTWNAPNLSGLKTLYDCEIVLGGSGHSLASSLPHEIEHTCPDYSLFGLDYSMGFSSRGCVRECPFCVVPQKEGFIRDHAPITEFLAPGHNKILLLDNNFLAAPSWNQKLDFIQQSGLKVCFSQGLDIRLVSPVIAGRLADTDFSNQNWTDRRLIFAWDFPQIEPAVIRGINYLNEAGIKGRYLMFYILTGYNTSLEQDYHRFSVLESLGVDPFVMIYNNQGSPILRKFARFINKRLYRTRTFDQYEPLTPAERWEAGRIIQKAESEIAMGVA